MRLPCISRHLDEDAHVRHEQLAQHKGKGKGRGGVVAAEPQQFLRLQQVEGGAVTGAGGGRHVESSASPTAAAASSAPSPTRSQRNAAIASLKRMPSMKDHHRKERSHMLSRVEFLVALVKIAVNRFVLTKEMDDVSQVRFLLTASDGFDLTCCCLCPMLRSRSRRWIASSASSSECF